MCHLHLPDAGKSQGPIPIHPGQSLLEATLAAGVPMDHSCRNGTCRTCLSHLAAGQIRYRVEWPGLSAEERTAGDVLPCVAEPAGPPHTGDITLVAVPLRRPWPANQP